MNIEFSKYHGTGNDFILIDNPDEKLNGLTQTQIAKLCDRHFGIGADGLMLLNPIEGYDFEMKNFNSDGSVSSMCGNGARCLVQFAAQLKKEAGIHQREFRFLAQDGPHHAKIIDGRVYLSMQNVQEVKTSAYGKVLNTGSPHLVRLVKDLEQHDVFAEGRKLRHDPLFAPDGLNVNFVQITHSLTHEAATLSVRTFERGVEDETWSCGTGVIASALVAIDHSIGHHSVKVSTRGGELEIHFQKRTSQSFEDIWLIGPAECVFQGKVLL